MTASGTLWVTADTRPEVNAERIIFLYLLNTIIDSNIDNIDNKLIARYSLTKYAIMFIVRNILEKDELGIQLLQNPSDFLSDGTHIFKLIKAFGGVVDDIIIDLNGEVNDLGEDFDYKSKLRDEHWVKELSRNIVSNYQKLVNRKRIKSFKEEWEDDNE